MPNVTITKLRDYSSSRSQQATILLAALRELRVGCPKQEILALIQSQNWFALEPEDRISYPTQTEPRWHTLIAWARQDCVDAGFISNRERDSWEPTVEGLNFIPHLKQAIAHGTFNVRMGFLWTAKLKTLLDPSYQPSLQDKKRPKYFYKDHLPPWLRSARGTKLVRSLDDLL